VSGEAAKGGREARHALSAPPIAVVMCVPSSMDSPAVAPSAARQVATGVAGASSGSRQATQARKRPRLTASLAGSEKALDDSWPFSFMNATMLPVNVMPPMSVPAQMAGTAVPGCNAKETMPVMAAARPTSEWKAATSCGRSVMAVRTATKKPAAPPTASTDSICTPSAAERPPETSAPSVEAMPSETPMTPSALPARAVSCDARPPIAPMQHSAEASPAAACSAGGAAPEKTAAA